ncbi:unnamed protein product [Durusdinium trenchii]
MSLPRAQDFDLFDELDRMRPRLSFKVEDDDLENYQVHQASTIFDFLTSKVERTNIQSFLELKDKPEDGRRRASTCSTCATLAEVHCILVSASEGSLSTGEASNYDNDARFFKVDFG